MTDLDLTEDLIDVRDIIARIEEIDDPTMREIRYLDKLVDELAKGRPMAKVLGELGVWVRMHYVYPYPHVDDVVGLSHSYGCGVAIDAPDAVIPIRTLRHISLNPNFGGEVMVVSLGCEKLQPERLMPPGVIPIADQRGQTKADGEPLDAAINLSARFGLFIQHHGGEAEFRRRGRGGHARRARTDDGHFFARLVLGRLWRDPAFRPSTVNDGVLDRLDADGVIVVVQSACCFTRRGANATRELWEVIGALQHINCRFPVPLVDQVVEVRNDVVDRAAVVTKRRAAIHTTRALVFGLFVIQANHKLFVIFQTLGNWLVAFFDALKLHESGDFSHDGFP